MKDQRKKNRELIKFQSLHYMFNQIYELYLKYMNNKRFDWRRKKVRGNVGNFKVYPCL